MGDPNFSIGDAAVPAWPHFLCGNGFAWHPEAKKRGCFWGMTAAPAELVAGVFSGSPIDRVWSLRVLLLGDGDRHPPFPQIQVRLFGAECHNHGAIGYQMTRAAVALHPGALEALREARPTIRELLDLDQPEERRRIAREHRSRPPGLPVRDDPDLTRVLQISWAAHIEAARRAQLEEDVAPWQWGMPWFPDLADATPASSSSSPAASSSSSEGSPAPSSARTCRLVVAPPPSTLLAYPVDSKKPV